MTDKPILFSGPMIRALLDGHKTQTRRMLRHPRRAIPDRFIDKPSIYNGRIVWIGPTGDRDSIKPSHAPGDRLWVRETWHTSPAYEDLKPSEMGGDESILYAADGLWESWGWGDTGCVEGGRKRPGIHMPRWASRLTLTVTDVRVQRVQDINRGDAMEEGCPFANMQDGPDPRDWFRDTWNTLNASRGFAWDANPWVVAITFTVHRCNIDQMEIANAD